MDIKNIINKATVTRETVANPTNNPGDNKGENMVNKKTNNYPTNLGQPQFVFTVTRKGNTPAKSGSVKYLTTGNGSLVQTVYGQPFMKSGILWRDGKAVDTVKAGAMFMAILPDSIAEACWAALDDGSASAGDLQIHIWDATVGAVNKAPYLTTFEDGVGNTIESMIIDVRLEGDMKIALVRRGEGNWIVIRGDLVVVDTEALMPHADTDIKTTATSLDFFRARLRKETETVIITDSGTDSEPQFGV